VEQATAMRVQRVGSRIDGEKAVIREEGASGDFLFYFRVDGSVACWPVRTSRSTNTRLDKMDALLTALSIELLTCEQKKQSFLACTHTIN
jgi:hypothetical protein